MKEEIVKALKELGEDAKTIAETLEKLGIKGKIGSPCNCPLANYLNGKISSVVYVSIAEVTFEKEIEEPTEEETVSFCESNLFHFTNFVSNFDEGEYPRLVDNT